jgi:two-component system chemotaxis response regulator CheB
MSPSSDPSATGDCRLPIVVTGASAGGVLALRKLVAELPADFPAVMLVVLHVGEHASRLPQLLSWAGPLPAKHAVNGEKFATGQIYIAPPDHHLMVGADALVLSRGSKEHHTRPAIDVLFRSAALNHRERSIGVVLSGALDDGTAGLAAIKQFGGVAIVQDPDEAQEPGMPLSALRHVAVDRRLPVHMIARELVDRVRRPRPSVATGTREQQAIAHEHAVCTCEGDPMEHLAAIARPSGLVCPDCRGGLWEIERSCPPRYRCHTGHGFTLRTLASAHDAATDEALWSAIRALQEKAIILRRSAQQAAGLGDASGHDAADARAEAAERQATMLRGLAERA